MGGSGACDAWSTEPRVPGEPARVCRHLSHSRNPRPRAQRPGPQPVARLRSRRVTPVQVPSRNCRTVRNGGPASFTNAAIGTPGDRPFEASGSRTRRPGLLVVTRLAAKRGNATARPRAHMKFCGSMSIATRRLPRSFGDARERSCAAVGNRQSAVGSREGESTACCRLPTAAHNSSRAWPKPG